MRYMNDSEAAEMQLKKAMELDPDAYQIQIELARAYLYLGRHSETLEVIRALRERPDLQVFHLKKIYDLHLQHYYRRAESQLAKKDNVDTLQNLEKLRETFENLPPHIVDEGMLQTVRKASDIARRLITKLRVTEFRQRGTQIYSWLYFESNRTLQEWPVLSLGEQLSGSIVKLQKEQSYGFIQTPDMHEVFFHRINLGEPWAWDTMEIGTQVKFTLGESPKGWTALYVCIDDE